MRTRIRARLLAAVLVAAGCGESPGILSVHIYGELTIHGDHLFYDDLFAAEPNVAFDVLAQADDEGDGDGEIAEAELRAFDIGGLKRYQVGSTGIDNLWDFLAYQTTTLGHIDGEGHCETEVLALE